MACEGARGLITTTWRQPDGSTVASTRPPTCGKWTCPSCKKYRAGKMARRLLELALPGQVLWVATVPRDRHETVRKAAARRGGGRLLVALEGEMHLHVASVDCLTQQRVRPHCPTWQTTSRSAADVAAALRDPLIPISNTGKTPSWAGDWSAEEEDEFSADAVLVFWSVEEREKFTFCFDYPPRTFVGRRVLGSDPMLSLILAGQFEWWKVNMRGWSPSGKTVPIAPLH